MPNSIYMGFDFGTKKMGIAIGQSLTKTARPLTLLKAKQGQPDWSVLKKLLEEWRPTALVVGIPLNMDGSEQPITQKAKVFCKELMNRFNIPVHTVDERLTTVTARSELFAKGGYKALTKANVDSFAAQILLESWLRENM